MSTMPDRDPDDQQDDDQQDDDQQDDDQAGQPTAPERIEVAEIDQVLPPEVRDLLLELLRQGLSASDAGRSALLSRYQGFVPLPQMLRDYDDLVENGAERAMTLAERNMDLAETNLGVFNRRHDAAIADRQAGRQAERRGQYFALIFLMGILALGGAGIAAGQAVLGSSLTLLSVATVCYVLIRGRY